jgi:hypothetical protein
VEYLLGDYDYDNFLPILDRLLSPTNFPHKHHGAIPSRYGQIRAGEFGEQTEDGGTEDGGTEDNWFSKGLIKELFPFLMTITVH